MLILISDIVKKKHLHSVKKRSEFARKAIFYNESHLVVKIKIFYDIVKSEKKSRKKVLSF